MGLQKKAKITKDLCHWSPWRPSPRFSFWEKTSWDEKSTIKCGICDVCLSEKSIKNIDVSFEILSILKQKSSLTSQEINQHLQANEKDILIHLRKLLSENKIHINHQNKYQLKQK